MQYFPGDNNNKVRGPLMKKPDAPPWTRAAIIVVAMVAVAMVLDGLDAQALGLAIPPLMLEWGLTRADFAPIAAGSLLGMAIGATFGGLVGDRIGRRAALIGSIVLFGLATALATLAQGRLSFGALRALAGLGLGATLPNASALIAEFTPLRYRSIGMSIAQLSQPVGSMIAGLLAAALLEGSGWRSLFLIGGAAPLVLAALFAWRLPESPGILANGAARDVPRASLSALLVPERRRDTLIAWLACFLSLLALYSVLSWMPAMLTAEHMPLAFTGTAIAIFSIGGITGSLGCGLLITRFGSRTAQTVIGATGVAGALLMIALFRAGLATPATIGVLMAFIGVGAAGTQATLYSLGAHLYPTELRATGIGAVLGLGRLGAVASSWVGAAAVDAGGAVGFFVLFGAAIGAATIACVSIRRSIPAAAA
ncbi:MAG TPA: MFS transporter [Steroidobacteraceae bacterium]|nr:MFS transporter [Steroidobacteraceae bacterium]